MTEAFGELPWWLTIPLSVIAILLAVAPLAIWHNLDRIRGQNERIIALLIDIKLGVRE